MQMLPVLELVTHYSKMNAQNDTCEGDFEPEEDTIKKDTLFKMTDIGLFHSTAEIELHNQQNQIIIDIQALHQFFETIPTPPPLFS